MSWNVRMIIIIPFLVFSGRMFVIIAWRLLDCRNASCVWLSAVIALCVGWSGDRSQFGCQCNASYFFLFEGTDPLVVSSHVNKLAVLYCAHNKAFSRLKGATHDSLCSPKHFLLR